MPDSNSAPRDLPGSPAAAKLFFAMLAGSDRTGYLEQRGPAPDGRWSGGFWRTDRLQSMAEQLLMVGKARDVYVGCAPRTHRHGGLDAVPSVYCLWADLDGPEAVDLLAGFPHRPTVVIQSGTGPNRHCYWQLSRPLDADEGRRALRRLAHRLGADMACAEPARVLRPPFTTNHKTDPPAPVEIEHLDVTAFDPAELVGELPDPPERPSCNLGTARPIGVGDDPLLAIPPTVYVEALTGRQVGRDGKIACPFHEDRTPSLHVYPTVERGWCCHAGCGGGTVIDFGAKLYGIEPRGAGFHQIRQRLEADLRGQVAA